MPMLRRVLLPALCAVLASPLLAFAAPAPTHDFGAVAISPDGRTLVAVESEDTSASGRIAPGMLVLRSLSGQIVHTLDLCHGADGCAVSAPAWSPDGRTLAFLVSDRLHGIFALWTADAALANPKRLVQLNGTLGAPRYSADGSHLAALATAGAHKQIGATQAGAPLSGAIGTDVDEQRIAVVGPDGKLSYASPPDMFVYEYDWLPDGSGFVGTAAHGNGDNNWWVARLYAFSAGNARELYAPPLQIASPRVSPDGRYVAFIGGIMSDFGSTGGDVYLLALSGNGAVDATPDMHASATSLLWNRSSDRVTFTELAGANEGVATVDVASHAIATQWSGPQALGADNRAHISVASDGVTSAVVVQDFVRAPELATGPLGRWRAVTQANVVQPAAGRAVPVSWTNEGFTLSGWLLEPLSTQTGKRFPMIVEVHGGPSAAFGARYVGRGIVRDLLARGYFVFMPNPRGSFGEGEAFTHANVRDFGYGDLRDVLSGIDAVEKTAPVDDKRLGITGYSYGGYMTMWTVTQTQRFKAAVAGAGISDWLSYYGENGIDEWMIPFFGASVYDDPQTYAKSSPITFIKNVKTPTFEFVGDRDVECPMPQTQEFWHALVTLGVPTSFVVYPGEGHGIRQPAHQRDITARTLAWFDRYLK